MPNGDLVVAGNFTTAGSVAVENIARWHGSAWSRMTGGSSGAASVGQYIYTLLVEPNGDLIVGGTFTQIEGVAANHVARWNGTSWVSMNYPGVVPLSMCRLANGDLLSADLNYLMRWNNGSWVFEPGISFGYVNDAIGLPDGSVVVTGHFQFQGAVLMSNIGRLHNGVWSPLGIGLDGDGLELALLPDGDLLVVGAFTHATDAGGSKVVDGIARWDGQSWSAFGGSGHSVVQNVVRRADDSLVFAGRFPDAAGVTTHRLATLASACPAQAMTFGLGCPGTAGPIELVAEQRPWLGAIYRASASGLSGTAIGLGVFGFAQAQVPLAPALPAGPACFLYSSADGIELLPPSAGVATAQPAVPDGAALIGAALHHQVLAVEFGAVGILDVSASNGLLLTIGSL